MAQEPFELLGSAASKSIIRFQPAPFWSTQNGSCITPIWRPRSVKRKATT